MSDAKPAAIDINMGCPVRKVVTNGEGSALMKDEVRAYEIVCAVKEASAVPVTVKMRSGFDREHKNAVRIARLCEKAGASAVCVHGRTREDMYRPPVDLEIIREVKDALRIPVIGNGELMSPKDALRMKEYTGCDALMIARGALGNPFIFGQIKAAFAGKTPTETTLEERLLAAKEHLRLLIEEKGRERGTGEARKHIAWYIRGMPGAALMRDAVNRAPDPEALSSILDGALEFNNSLTVQSQEDVDIPRSLS